MTGRLGRYEHGVSYDKDPMKDRLARISRYESVVGIVSQMRSNPHVERVQRLGCYSLANLSCHNYDETVKINMNRGAAAVVLAMKNHPNSEGLQHWGCAALACMSQGSENGRKIVAQEGGATAVAAAMNSYQVNESIMAWGNEMLHNAQHHPDGSAMHPLETPARRSIGSVLAEARASANMRAMAPLEWGRPVTQ